LKEKKIRVFQEFRSILLFSQVARVCYQGT
jgi:hypothetical protein